MMTTDYEPLLVWVGNHDLRDSLYWYEKNKCLSFYLLCNDVFWWATADGEDVTVEDIPDLQKAWEDLMAADPDGLSEMYAPELWIARKRKMRPQTPWWNREEILPSVRELFLAAGPERDRASEG